MPIQRCRIDGRSGFKWGESGRCYAGSNARAKAAKQAAAIRASGWTGNIGQSTMSVSANTLALNSRKKVRTQIARSNTAAGRLKSDPTRTKMLRAAFERELRKKYAALKAEIVLLVQYEDAFGLKVHNTSTEEQEQNVDIGSSGNGGSLTTHIRGYDKGAFVNSEFDGRDHTSNGGRHRNVGNTNFYDFSSSSKSSGVSAIDLDQLTKERNDGSIYNNDDGSRDRTTFGRDDLRGVGSGVVHSMSVGSSARSLNQRFAFATSSEKVVAYEEWLKTKFDDVVVSDRDAYWERYVAEGYNKGAGRAFDDTYKARRAMAGSQEQLAYYQGSKEQFLQDAFGNPESLDKVKLLAGRTLTDLKNVNSVMATQMSRALVDGLTQGIGAIALAKNLTSIVGDNEYRAMTIARTELIRAHAEGQLDAMEKMGVEEVGVMVEWSSAGDDRVCPLCQDLDGVVLKISEARGIIPRHPNAVFAGSTFASYGQALELVRAWYDGPSVILMAGDHRTTIGPNHPMVTRRGLVPAAQITKGDEVLYDTRHDNLFSFDVLEVNLKEMPSIENVFQSSLSVLKNPRVTSSGSDLHGDRKFCQGEVQAITPAGSLLIVADPLGVEKLCKTDFMLANTESEAMSALSSGSLSFDGVSLPSSGGVGGSNPGILTHDCFTWLRVHDVSFGRFEGWAFDGTTASSLYCNTGFVVKNCRCCHVPANVGEPLDTKRRVNYGDGSESVGQTRSKSDIEASIKSSIGKERKRGSIEDKIKKSRWLGADKVGRIAKVRPSSPLYTKVPDVKTVSGAVTKSSPSSLFETVEAERVFFASGRELTREVKALSDVQLRTVFKELNDANLDAIKKGRRKIGTEPKWITALRKEKERRFGVTPSIKPSVITPKVPAKFVPKDVFVGKPANPVGKTSYDRFRLADGSWTPERQALHNEIIADYLKGVEAVENPKAFMMGGGPASGKSSVLDAGHIKMPKNTLAVDSDKIKGYLPEYIKGVADGDVGAAAFAHEESSYLGKKILAEAANKKGNVLLDGTGDNSIDNLRKKIKMIKSGGQKVEAHYMTMDTELSVKIEKARAAKTGRKVPESFLRETHAAVSDIVPKAIKEGLFDEITIWDNNIKGQPIRIASAKGKKLVVHDKARWEKFLAKADEIKPKIKASVVTPKTPKPTPPMKPTTIQQAQVDSQIRGAKLDGDEATLYRDKKGNFLVATEHKHGLSRVVLGRDGSIKSLGSGGIDEKVWTSVVTPKVPAKVVPKTAVKEWMGDSKLVTDQGLPVKMFRGTARKDLAAYGGPESTNMIFLTPDEGFAARYAGQFEDGKVYKLFVRANNPIDISREGYPIWKQYVQEMDVPSYGSVKTNEGMAVSWQQERPFRAWLEKKGIKYDAIYFGENDGSRSLAVRRVSQLKEIK